MNDIMRRQVSRVTMPLAIWLDRRHPDWCWASLCVDLGLAYDLRGWRSGAEDSLAVCQRDCRENGSCWCGKMATPAMRARWAASRDNPNVPF